MKVWQQRAVRTGRASSVVSTLALFATAFLFFAMGTAKPVLAGPEAKAAKYEVAIDNFSFGPTDLTVPAGSTVTWVNHDDVPHTVVSTEKKFASQALDTGEKFSFEFKTAGTYEYFCSLHPKMTAKVVVQ